MLATSKVKNEKRGETQERASTVDEIERETNDASTASVTAEMLPQSRLEMPPQSRLSQALASVASPEGVLRILDDFVSCGKHIPSIENLVNAMHSVADSVGRLSASHRRKVISDYRFVEIVVRIEYALQQVPETFDHQLLVHVVWSAATMRLSNVGKICLLVQHEVCVCVFGGGAVQCNTRRILV
jgi:hypothetical protein